jgi:hypothetical protein
MLNFHQLTSFSYDCEAHTRRPSEWISLEVEGKKNSSPEVLAVSNFWGRMLSKSVAVDLVVG